MSGLSFKDIRSLRIAACSASRDHEVAILRLKKLLVDLDAAERVLHSVPLMRRTDPPLDYSRVNDSDNPYRPGSVRALIWSVLAQPGDDWLDTNIVRERVMNQSGRRLSLQCVASTLTFMKGKTVLRHGRRVALAAKVAEASARGSTMLVGLDFVSSYEGPRGATITLSEALHQVRSWKCRAGKS